MKHKRPFKHLSFLITRPSSYSFIRSYYCCGSEIFIRQTFWKRNFPLEVCVYIAVHCNQVQSISHVQVWIKISAPTSFPSIQSINNELKIGKELGQKSFIANHLAQFRIQFDILFIPMSFIVLQMIKRRKSMASSLQQSLRKVNFLLCRLSFVWSTYSSRPDGTHRSSWHVFRARRRLSVFRTERIRLTFRP